MPRVPPVLLTLRVHVVMCACGSVCMRACVRGVRVCVCMWIARACVSACVRACVRACVNYEYKIYDNHNVLTTRR